jgi:hypothetical protein
MINKNKYFKLRFIFKLIQQLLESLHNFFYYLKDNNLDIFLIIRALFTVLKLRFEILMRLYLKKRIEFKN